MHCSAAPKAKDHMFFKALNSIQFLALTTVALLGCNTMPITVPQLEMNTLGRVVTDSSLQDRTVRNQAEIDSAQLVGRETIVARVRVVSDALPVSGALIAVKHEVRSFHGQNFTHVFARAVTDSNGWATLTFHQKPEPVWFTEVTCDSYLPAEIPFAANQVIELNPVPFAKGRVQFPDGRDAVGARVFPKSPAGISTLTGPNGRFELRVPKDVAIFVELNGLAASEPEGWAVLHKEINLTLVNPAPCLGKVVDVEKKPIEGVQVEMKNPMLTRTVATDANGVFRSTCAPGIPPEMRFMKPDYKENTGIWNGMWSMNFTFQMEKQSHLSGTVQDDQGHPIANALVKFATLETRTLANGSFVLNNIEIESRGGLTAVFDGVQVTLPLARISGMQRLDFVIPRATTNMTIDVRNKKGEAVPDWSASITTQDQSWSSSVGHSRQKIIKVPMGMTRVSVTGHFIAREQVVHVGLAPQEVRFVVENEPPEEIAPNSFAADDSKLSLGDEKPVPLSIRVAVKLKNGKPVANAQVGCSYEWGFGHCTTNFKGVCKCPLALEYSKKVSAYARSPNLYSAAEIVNFENPAHLVMQSVDDVRGRVVGVLAEGAFLVLNSKEEFLLTGNTFTIPSTKGRVCIAVRDGGYHSERRFIGCGLLEGNEREITIPVGVDGFAVFRFLDETGKPIELPSLFVSGDQVENIAPAGELVVKMAPGNYNAILKSEGRRAEAILTVRSDETTVVPIMQLK
jgi:hypothetical protein